MSSFVNITAGARAEVNDVESAPSGQSTTSSGGSNKRFKPSVEVRKASMVGESAQGCVENVKQLLSSIRNATDHKVMGKTALHMASRNGHLETSQLLLAAGAAINCRDDDGNTALHHAAEGHQAKILELLLNSGAHIDSVNKSKRTALHIAVKNSWLDCITVLLKYECQVNVQDSDGDTPLHYALRCPEASNSQNDARTCFPSEANDRITKMLVTAPNIALSLETHQGESYLDIGAKYGRDYGVELLTTIAKELLNHTHRGGWTALHTATFYGHCGVCETLIACAPSLLNQENTYGNTPLHIAVQMGECSLIEFMVSKGADCNLQNSDGQTALHFAFSKIGYATFTETVEINDCAMENSSQINDILSQLSYLGETCMFLAIGCYLIRDGHADVTLKSLLGHSSLDFLDKRLGENHNSVKNFVLEMVQARSAKDRQRIVTLEANHEVLSQKVKDLELKAKEDEDARRCQICIDEFKNVVFLCGHGTCQKCAESLDTCHLCRKIITEKIKCH